MSAVLLSVSPASRAVLPTFDYQGATQNFLEALNDRHKLVQCVVQHVADALAVACDEPLGMLAQLWQAVEAAFRC